VPNLVFQHPSVDSMDLAKHVDVYYIDCTPPEPDLREIAARCNTLVILDHHKTAMEEVKRMQELDNFPANVVPLYDMLRSGATISFDFFRELMTTETDLVQLRKIYEYVEDHDLWRHQLPDSKAFSLGLAELRIDYNANNNPELFPTLLNLDVAKLKEEGKSKGGEQQQIIEQDIDKSFQIDLGQFGSFLAVLTEYGQLRSEMGNQLALKSQAAGLRGIGAVVYREGQIADASQLKVSFRTIPEEDASAIAKHYNGGGHKNACSCVVPETTFAQWRK